MSGISTTRDQAIKKCPSCGDVIHSDSDGMCYRCRQSGVRLRQEIYDMIQEKEDPTAARFSDLALGNLNYKRMRRRNVQGDGPA